MSKKQIEKMMGKCSILKNGNVISKNIDAYGLLHNHDFTECILYTPTKIEDVFKEGEIYEIKCQQHNFETCAKDLVFDKEENVNEELFVDGYRYLFNVSF